MPELQDQQVPAGRRERNRQALRRRLSDTATAMFLERGFDAVRVADIAQACGVSTKTVWNHFPTKEALLLDRGERLATALRAVAGQPTSEPDERAVLQVVLTCIETEIDELAVGDSKNPEGRPDGRPDGGTWSIHAFVRLAETHPGLRAAAADRSEQLVRLAADALASRGGDPASSPRNQILAGALISLWRLHLSAVLHDSAETMPLQELQERVRHQVRQGADLIARLLVTTTSDPARTG